MQPGKPRSRPIWLIIWRVVQKWTDLLTPSAAALAILFAIALTIQSIRHGRAVKRLESRIADQEGAGARVSLDRLRELQKRGRTSSDAAPATATATRPADPGPRTIRRGPNLAPIVAILAVVAVIAGTTWYLFFRGDGPETAGTNGTTTTAIATPNGTTTQQTPVPAENLRTTPDESPPALPGGKGAYTIMVQNGSGVNGVAANVTPRVAGFGYATTDPTNATQNVKQSFVVYVDPSKIAVADNVAKDLGIKRIAPPDGVDLGSGTDGVDAVVVVGNDEVAARYRP